MSGRPAVFHVTLHARPPGSFPTGRLQLDPFELPVLLIPPAQLQTPFPISFERACEQLARLPRLFIEPDGSFVWVSAGTAGQPWQVDGVLYDRHGRLLYVELKGTCPREAWDLLQAACGLPNEACVVQLLRHAAIVAADDFLPNWLGHQRPPD